MKVIYFTHCCARKDDSLKGKESNVTPLQLYKATPTQRFMKRCIEMNVDWAIFSDKHGFVFPDDRIQWYEKHPDTVTETEKTLLFARASDVLRLYDIAYFYYNPGRFHPLYEEFLEEMIRKGRDIRKITHLDDIPR